MTDYRTVLEHDLDRVGPADFTLDDVARRRDRKRRNERITAAVVGIAVALAVGLTGAGLIRSVPEPASPTPTPTTPTPTPASPTPMPALPVLRSDGEVLRAPVLEEKPGKLVAVDPVTGKIRVLVEKVDGVYSAMWSPDGRWVAYYELAGEGLWVMNGKREPRELATGTIEDWTWSPTAPHLAMVLDYSRLIVVDAWTGRRTDLGEVADSARPVWTRDGTRVLYGVRGGSLYSVDVRSGEHSLFLQLPGDDLDSMDELEWAPDGAHLAVMNDLEPGGGRLYVMNEDGSGVRILLENYLPAGFAWSPDGMQLTYAALSRSDERRLSLWTVSIDGSDRTRLGSHLIECSEGPAPVWSPDGTQIAFRADPTQFFVANADGTGGFRRLNQLTYLSWSGGSYSATARFGCLG